MGYMSLKVWQDSDNAAGLRFVVVNDMIKALNQGMIEPEHYGTNTDGYVNVALFIESGALQPYEGYEVEGIHWKRLLKGLEDHVKDSSVEQRHKWTNDEAGRVEHHLAYKRMLRAVKHFMDSKEIVVK